MTTNLCPLSKNALREILHIYFVFQRILSSKQTLQIKSKFFYEKFISREIHNPLLRQHFIHPLIPFLKGKKR